MGIDRLEQSRAGADKATVTARRIIVTGADSRYFGSLTSLLGSILEKFASIELILVYDLGLSSIERRILSRVRKVLIREVPPFCPHYRDLHGFAWKTAAVCDALEYGEAILWLDAGIEIQRALDDLFETIEHDGYLFTVTPLDQENCKIGTLSHQRSLELLGADTEFFRNSLMVNAGVMGYLRNHLASALAYEAMHYAANPEIILGPRYSHRHDQTIYSILRVKNRLPAQYHMFHLENVERKYRFLVRASQQEPIPAHVLSGWRRTDLHIYLLVTRDHRPYARLGSLEFLGAPFVPWFLLAVRIATGKPAVFLKKRWRRITARLQGLAIGNET